MMMITEVVGFGFGFCVGVGTGVGAGVNGADVGITPGPVLDPELQATVVPSAPKATTTKKA